MLVNRLELTNVRGVDSAEFVFRPGLNLIVGVNGAGKTTALDALAVCVEAVTRRVNGVRGRSGRSGGLTAEDISVQANALSIQLDFAIDGKAYAYVYHQSRESVVAQSGKSGVTREQTLDTPSISDFAGAAPPRASGGRPRPYGILFSARRAVPNDRNLSKAASAGGHAAALADAFSPRELRLGEFAAWLRTRVALSSEDLEPARMLDAFEQAVSRFLPQYSGIRVSSDDPSRLLVTRQGYEIPVRQLSDGERGILALVFDLTRRLAQANPGLADPAADGVGVVLIDEIDLHLHPRWQRTIVRQLPETFPNLQFIATTHSPQVIGEVPPDRVQIMGEGPVFSPEHSLGVDSNRVLEEIMDASPRMVEVQELLGELSERVDEDDLAGAQAVTDQLSATLGDSDPEVLRARTLLDFLAEDE